MVSESYVQNSTFGNDVPAKNAGNIYLYAKNINLESSVVLTSSRGNGNAGKIVIKTGQLHLSKNGKLLYASWLWSRNTASGNSGGITIQADEIVLEDGADVSTENIGSGNSNDIDIQTNYLTIRGADKKRGRATAIFSNAEGNLRIEEPQFIINSGKIVARAFESHGGNINLESEKFISSPNSIVSASSKLGITGTVKIESIDIDLTGALKTFGTNFLNAAAHMKRPCTIEDIMEPDTF